MLELTRVGFSGHETFPFRSGWLRKGFRAALENERVFFDQDKAMTLLGVGKNMVRSIRHWCLATQVLQEHTGKQKRGLVPTNFGFELLQKFDPYLEDIGALWLIHWKLASNSERATTWYAVFSSWFQSEFTKDDLVRFLTEIIDFNRLAVVSESTLRRDVDCFVRTYVPIRTSSTVLLEDTLDCPLSELNLITELSDRRTYRLQRGSNTTLHDSVLAFIIADYWCGIAPTQSSLSFEELMYGPGSPGRLLRFEENAMVERLERMESVTKGLFQFTTSAGLRQLLRSVDFNHAPSHLLEAYYSSV